MCGEQHSFNLNNVLFFLSLSLHFCRFGLYMAFECVRVCILATAEPIIRMLDKYEASMDYDFQWPFSCNNHRGKTVSLRRKRLKKTNTLDEKDGPFPFLASHNLELHISPNISVMLNSFFAILFEIILIRSDWENWHGQLRFFVFFCVQPI